MEIIQIDRKDLGRIKPLWEKLNCLHRDRSEYFSDYFERFTFEKRIEEFALKPALGIFAAAKEKKLFAYCIASLDEHGMGEIDSLYVSKDCRGQKIGQHLMEKTLVWLDKKCAKKIRISVAGGNEQAFGFYEKFGFKPRFSVLEQVKPEKS